jgi:hypothetical protein
MVILSPVVIRQKTIFAMTLCAGAVAATFYLLAFGVAVLLGAPTRPGQGFWRPEKFFYGFLPVFATPAILAITLRRWVRLFARTKRLAGRKNPVGLAERIVCLQLGNWQVKMPAGFTYSRENGIDTFIGRFTSEDGSLVIGHDIGELAAERAMSPRECVD